jgi:hypothetical protein
MATCETCGQTLPDGEELTVEKIKAMSVEEAAERLDEINKFLTTSQAGDDDGE